MEKTQEKSMGSWFKEEHLYRSTAISLKQKCERMVSHVYHVASNGCVNLSWSQEEVKKVESWETVMMRRFSVSRKKKKMKRGLEERPHQSEWTDEKSAEKS